MGVRKHKVAEERKEANKTVSFAKLNNCPTSPRKMRLVADMVRGLSIDKALYLLKYKAFLFWGDGMGDGILLKF